MKNTDLLREHLIKLLGWQDAHVDFETAIKGISPKLLGVQPEGLPYSLWQLVEHMRLAQRDILEFCRDPGYHAPKWPDDYWPLTPAPPDSRAWKKCLDAFRADHQELLQLIADPVIDLYAGIPHGDGQTYLREFLLVADHNAFHLGQVVAVRRWLGDWK